MSTISSLQNQTTIKITAPITIFIHVCMINIWRQKLEEHLSLIVESGLYEECEQIFLGVLGNEDEIFKEIAPFIQKYPKVSIKTFSNNLSIYERITLKELYNFSVSNPGARVLYLHTKGVKNMSSQIDDWIHLMQYFLITKWRDCYQMLDLYDVCGVNHHSKPASHFSGNFWWTRCDYISQNLSRDIGPAYTDPEMWLCSSINVRPFCMHSSNTNHYHQSYPKEKYQKTTECIEKKTYDENAPNWLFFQGRDSGGGDCQFVGRKNSLEELLMAVESNPSVVAFNTLGFLKTKVYEPLTTSPYFGPEDGLFVNNFIRVKLMCNWCPSEELCRACNKMTKGNFQWNRLQFTWGDDNIDFYVIMNKPLNSQEKFVPSRTIVFQMEPWCFSESQNWGVKTWGEWARPDPAKFLQVRSHDKFCNNVIWQFTLNFNELCTFKPEKTKGNIISSICSSKYFDPGHIKRIDFLKYIEAQNDDDVKLHIYNEDNDHKFSSYQGTARPDVDKEKGIVPYKYYFMCENNEEKNFITEKLWEPLLTDTLVFYWGCPNVADWIDPRAFVQLDMNDFEASFAIMKNAIKNDLWLERLPFIRAEKEKVLYKYSMGATVEQTIKDFYSSSNKNVN